MANSFDSMTVFRSFVEATEDLPGDQFKEAWLAILHYGLDGEEDNLSSLSKMFFTMAKPVLDKGRVKKESGRIGGSNKSEANDKQTGSKQEANDKQTESKPEANESTAEANDNRSRNRSRNRSNDKGIGVGEGVGEGIGTGEGKGEGLKILEANASCFEPEADVEAIPLNDGTEWRPTQSEFEEFERLYPSVDVRREFAKMRGWSSSNPSRRKTKKGVKSFVNTWLSKEQDRSRGRESPINKYDATDLWAATGG